MRIAALSMATVLTVFGMKHALAAIKKVSKKIAHYRSHPNQGKMCMNCVHFLPSTPEMKRMYENMTAMGGTMQGMEMNGHPMMEGMMGLCEVVEGPVSPMGYCRLYSPVHRS